jgi:hypothetical protein
LSVSRIARIIAAPAAYLSRLPGGHSGVVAR